MITISCATASPHTIFFGIHDWKLMFIRTNIYLCIFDNFDQMLFSLCEPPTPPTVIIVVTVLPLSFPPINQYHFGHLMCISIRLLSYYCD